ncbi:biopolymer transporter ExbB [Amaricoccus solimangrovi]|uniref:Biopolymer transporter ExbB n=1 Tax=Amaricoccus solimangrovi TaxID=2589815 RepID=A0A501X0F0_9RHOB|nr:biopolymer transporter ExbB [Amaricoccus solimangrovi]TPE53857.1 biopolymer transporter ExbB [Amaricoccus solimangrovi]
MAANARQELRTRNAPAPGPRFSQPVRQIVMMLIVLGLVAALAVLLFPQVKPVFLASPWLNGFIGCVFVIGVASCFWEVGTLIASVSWIEGFALDRPGHEFTKAPGLLAPLAAMLSERRARRALTSTSSRSILDSVATRLDEQRDLTRYLINLLIFLGLLGTFYGLATVVPQVVNTIRSLAPEPGQDAVNVFDRLMSGLEGQLGGMGTAFASSLLGLAGSLVVGLLDLFTGHGQGRFYRELEEWLSSITKVGLPGMEGDEVNAGNVLAVLEHTAGQIESLREMIERMVARAEESDARVSALAEAMAAPEARAADRAVMERIAAAQERVASLLSARDEDTGRLDAETRARLRSIDTQVLRILEDLSAGRQDLVTEMRQELATLTEALRHLGPRRP